MESKKGAGEEGKNEIGDLSLNLDRYFGSRGISLV